MSDSDLEEDEEDVGVTVVDNATTASESTRTGERSVHEKEASLSSMILERKDGEVIPDGVASGPSSSAGPSGAEVRIIRARFDFRILIRHKHSGNGTGRLNKIITSHTAHEE